MLLYCAQSTTHLEQELLSKARSHSVMSGQVSENIAIKIIMKVHFLVVMFQSMDSVPESQREKAPLAAHDRLVMYHDLKMCLGFIVNVSTTVPCKHKGLLKWKRILLL